MTIGINAYIQQATYWAPGVQSGYGGKTFAAPVVLMTRWEDRAEEYVDANGVEQVSKSIVWSMSGLEIGGYLYRGNVPDLDPTQLNSAHKIQQTQMIPDLRGLHAEWTNFL